MWQLWLQFVFVAVSFGMLGYWAGRKDEEERHSNSDSA